MEVYYSSFINESTKDGLMKLISLVIAMFIGFSAQANDGVTIANSIVKSSNFNAQMVAQWVVGDKADYKVSIGGFINGTMNTYVREEVTEGFWIVQDMDLGFAGKQKVEMLIDHAGQILQLLVNGQKQDIPNQDDQEIIEMDESSVTVPAGTFDAIYVKVRNKKDNSESEAWINPEAVPVMGLVKQLANSQLGPVNVELTAYERG